MYFPSDGAVKVLPVGHVRAPDSVGQLYRRADMLDKTFYCDGCEDLAPGQWKVRRMVGNEYVCSRLTGGSGPMVKNMENFDIGYVMSEVVNAEQRVRES